MSTLRLEVGRAVVEWEEDEPLRWTMSEIVGKGKRAVRKTFSFDLTPLTKGYGRIFLLALRQCWIDRCLEVRVKSIDGHAFGIQTVLQACQDRFAEECFERAGAPPVFDRIDSDLLIGLCAIQGSLSKHYLEDLRFFYKGNRHNSELFQADLYLSDFPTGRETFDSGRLGDLGRLRRNILATALSRATLVHILNVTEEAYEVGELSLDLFAYSRLLLGRAARPESFRVLRLKDLQIDERDGVKSYYLTITIPKTKTADRPRATVRLHPDVGRILDQQRAAVAERLGGLIDEKNAALKSAAPNKDRGEEYTIGDLAMFPGGGATGRMTRETKDRLGILEGGFATRYQYPLRRLTSVRMHHNALRHTMGTQLAIAGCSAVTIAAVLLHATHRAAHIYVDLIFSGAIDELSDSMEQAFLEHYPVYKELISINDEIDPDRRIFSTSVDRSRRENTGGCRRQVCQDAPITCYDCHRFKPCYDADHTINLERVNEEIASAEGGGLPRQVDLKRFKHIANRIRVVINICEAKREAVAAEQEATVRTL
ncbi:hypothetical protein [Paraburkholderia sp. MM5384-R2]|uniref:hypothetical protein n=1 Tax=Paraburkholderia sp. MM5384-R2 TaxID=2723097 RepID=UPI001609A133|nr:hypothetical protein [Paraburkholderia sp. MM5384-R2]MBB5503157.1 hypothetical protein [Paraburkholderia sp. MM5384-R2]